MKTKSMLIAAIAALLVSTAASAIEATKIDSSGVWIATKMQDEFNGATACTVLGIDPDPFKNSHISIPIDAVMVSDSGKLISVVAMLRDETGFHTRNLADPSKVQILIDKKLANLADLTAFVDAAKAGTTMVYRWTDQLGGTHTDTKSLVGFTKAWDAARAACPKQQAE